ncbi:MAG: hypothetical protein AAB495_02360 [Patescibacteria group bacterium]
MLRKASLTLFLITLFASFPTFAKELPFYFPPGVVSTTDPMRQLQEYYRYMAAMDLCNQPSRDRRYQLIPGSDSVRVVTDIVSTSSITESSAKLTIILDNYVRIDGKIRVTSLCDQRFISERELQVVVDDLREQTKIAARRNFEYYRELTNLSVSALAGNVGLTSDEVRKYLDEKIPGYDVTYREFWYIPKPMRESDFVPRELHLGFTPSSDGGILAATWLNTGVIYYNPVARVSDYLQGIPKVLQHEMIHVNVNLQKFPLNNGFDVELSASIPVMLYPEDKIGFFFHGYSSLLREFAHTFFGYNFEQVRDEVVRVDLEGNLIFDEEKFRSRLQELESIKSELLVFFQNKALPEFYSNPVWWMSMNQVRNDPNSVFRIMMANNYDLTILGGHEKTMLWLKIHEPEILEIADEAFKEEGEQEGGYVLDVNIPAFLRVQYEKVLTPQEREELEKYFRENPEKLKGLVSFPKKLVEFIDSFVANQRKGGAQ